MISSEKCGGGRFSLFAFVEFLEFCYRKAFLGFEVEVSLASVHASPRSIAEARKIIEKQDEAAQIGLLACTLADEEAPRGRFSEANKQSS